MLELLYSGGFDVYYLNYASGSGAETARSTTAPVAGVDVVVAATVTPTNLYFYLDGAQQFTSAQSTANPTWSGASYLTIGGYPGYTSPSTDFYWCGLWDRALSAGEHAELARDPWQVFAPASSRAIFATTGSSVSFALAGPSTVGVGAAATFTVTPSGSTSGTVTPSASPSGGAFSPGILTWSGSSAAQTFTFTEGTAGSYSIAATASGGATVSGSPISLTVTAALGYTFTGPSTGTVGVAATFTVTPAGEATDAVAFTCSAGGTFSPMSLSWSDSSASQSVTFTAFTAGTYALVATSGDGSTVTGSPLAVAVGSSSGSARPARWFPGLLRRFRPR